MYTKHVYLVKEKFADSTDPPIGKGNNPTPPPLSKGRIKEGCDVCFVKRENLIAKSIEQGVKS